MTKAKETAVPEATRLQEVPFPGCVALTRVDVYQWESADGVCGGSPHMHTASTEAYLVLSGTGRVETIRSSGYQSYDLSPNDLLWFSPGTIHRLVNTENLNILVIMQNGGLPEAGDAVMTFEADIVADPKRYASTASLNNAASGTTPQAARIRRDAAFAGFKQLKEAALAGNFAAVEQFQRDAVRLVQAKVPGWQHLWTETIAAESARTEQWLADLAGGGFRHFKEAAISRTVPVSSEPTFGMCGLLQKWDSRPQT